MPPNIDAARARLLLWRVGTKCTLGLIYVRLIAEGWRFLVPALGIPVVFGLDGAIILAVFLMFAVWHLWELALYALFKYERPFERLGWDPENYKRLVLTMAGVLIVCDAGLFYVAMVKLGWRTATFSLPALLATTAYLAVLVFVSFVTVNLQKPILDNPNPPNPEV